MHAILFCFLDLFRSVIRAKRGWTEVDATRRVEEQRNDGDASCYVPRSSGEERHSRLACDDD